MPDFQAGMIAMIYRIVKAVAMGVFGGLLN